MTGKSLQIKIAVDSQDKVKQCKITLEFKRTLQLDQRERRDFSKHNV